MSNELRGCWRSPVTKALLGLLALFTSTHVLAEPLAIGPVERFDNKTNTLVVLGQQFPLDSASVIVGDRRVDARAVKRLLSDGAVVWVDGELVDGSPRVRTIHLLPEHDVPGATQLFVSGVVRAITPAGLLRIDGLLVDATVATSRVGGVPVQAGDVVQVFGTQPLPRGVFLATDIRVASKHHVGGTGGTSTQGVGGTGVQGVGGTGIQGVGGTGIQGVGGTGIQGVGGTGIQGVGGTGIQGVGGTGIQGVGGTGIQGVGGTGIQGVGGTGIQGVGGTGIQGVGGTGIQGVGGTGIQGVGGTGIQGVGGTGIQGVGGTGIQGVGGTGIQGVGGTGIQGVGGTGAN